MFEIIIYQDYYILYKLAISQKYVSSEIECVFTVLKLLNKARAPPIIT
jgi:hypothetical protein